MRNRVEVCFRVALEHARQGVREWISRVQGVGRCLTEVKRAVECGRPGRAARYVLKEDAELQGVRALDPCEVIGNRPVSVRAKERITRLETERGRILDTAAVECFEITSPETGRSEERRVGKECRARGEPDHE